MRLSQEEYISQRLEEQIEWYSRKSSFNRSMYNRLQVVAIVAAAAIPLLSGYVTDDSPYIRLLIGLTGMVVASVTAVLGLFKFQENWIAYRNTCEVLKQEKYLFLSAAAPYQGEDAFELLVQRAEAIMAGENTQWAQHMKKEPSQALL